MTRFFGNSVNENFVEVLNITLSDDKKVEEDKTRRKSSEGHFYRLLNTVETNPDIHFLFSYVFLLKNALRVKWK